MMPNIHYHLQFDKLCTLLQLGEIIREPETISGGLLHRMYTIETTLGKYAVKALNPQIMLRPVAMQHFIHSERIVTMLANNIPALPAKKFRGTSLQEIENQYYLVFDWVEGTSLKPNEIKALHCEKMGAILSDIHMMDFSGLGVKNDGPDHVELTDWSYYLQKGLEDKSEWANLLLENIDKLNEWNALANTSAKLLASELIISHRDLDPKNVMWRQNNPFLIDWESAGYIHPMQDLIETAIYWSENEMGNVDKERFFAFIDGYKLKCVNLEANWGIVLANGFLGKLGWLEYSLKRSLWIECTDEEEQMMGTAQVKGTIDDIRRYADRISELEEWLHAT